MVAQSVYTGRLLNLLVAETRQLLLVSKGERERPLYRLPQPLRFKLLQETLPKLEAPLSVVNNGRPEDALRDIVEIIIWDWDKNPVDSNVEKVSRDMDIIVDFVRMLAFLSKFDVGINILRPGLQALEKNLSHLIEMIPKNKKMLH
ncbi:hypothetical protein A2526_04485 [candidate division WOR-1 bacterium RIFOXYD2_FULL_36_8]|uniref:Uncharacterized protein n=1 Tax=candidate division WOR-1 bacterium RIFOXYB2_FULL_36_35 TaxID=1802578 RepID=A0A1F4RYU5_UNCSA|nr:MAG: hypothetical protein A2230_01190 [candidate division WOR-1 bacterium RIFOXYA2_FULL_36_21]OGC13329.1 MAG: hypothetical protein A2290_04680 [candidate division WOR-1 bacterium RIFOXYB2_FULL_36_35]OGC21036.1 MAG: hypothetical protein A2282_08445 [candidate division WOR-1 bacterium RIFOXYA12_FULL_36_13]OGC39130.1 MAG: hypothetical protein A2526_04485 [candidate division WOR-1 bacterium RIFOXYD2_FULL_36_8]